MAVKKVLEPFLPAPRSEIRQEVDLGLQAQALHRPREGLLRQLRSAGPRAGLYPGARWSGTAQRHHGRGAQRDLHPQGSEPYFDLPYTSPNMHEVVFSDDRQAQAGVRTGDIAKRLIDYGFHPYTVSFPLIVHGALMIEPTETEGKREIDQFIEAMISIANEVETDPQLVQDRAAHDPHQPRGRSTAARKPVLRWKPA